MTHPRATRFFTTAAFAVAMIIATPLLMGATTHPERPDMKLAVSTHHGYPPLDLVLEGSIKAADLSRFESCLMTVEWTYRTPGGQEMNSKKELACVEPASTKTLPGSFKMKVTLDEPGTYSYRVVLVSKSGKRFASASQEVKVIKSTLEVGGTATRTDDR